MTTRKMGRAQEIALLKNELETRRAFTVSAVEEAKQLHQKELDGKSTKKDEKRSSELMEIIHENRKFMERATREINAFYRPATA